MVMSTTMVIMMMMFIVIRTETKVIYPYTLLFIVTREMTQILLLNSDFLDAFKMWFNFYRVIEIILYS